VHAKNAALLSADAPGIVASPSPLQAAMIQTLYRALFLMFIIAGCIRLSA
jgi:hypothetical protein